MFAYFVINILYSLGLKNIPIVDILILASGFVIRVFYGGVITNIIISKWLYFVVASGSVYMGLGKRRNEIRYYSDTREVLKYYNETFLDKNMYVCMAVTNVFYALWTFDLTNPKVSWTSPIFFASMMCYSLDIEKNKDGDPIEVILGNKGLLLGGIIYLITVFILLYAPF